MVEFELKITFSKTPTILKSKKLKKSKNEKINEAYFFSLFKNISQKI